MPLPELTAVAAEASRAVPPEFARACAAFDARAGVLCRDIATRFSAGAPQADLLLSLAQRIVAEDEAAPPAVNEWMAYRDDPMFRMLEHCARALPAFIDGRVNGVDVIFPRGDRGMWARLQGESMHMAAFGRLAGAATHALAGPAGRILEIGAGSGAAAAAFLRLTDATPGGRYVFSDISPTLLRDARARFGPALDYALHDFTRPSSHQDLAGRQFDVVCGANALHCAADAAEALRVTVDLLLAPGGHLVLAEGARPASGRVWRPELIFAMLPGWRQAPTDRRLRPEVGFLTGPAWLTLLRQAGLSSVTLLPLGLVPEPVIGHVIVARKMGT